MDKSPTMVDPPTTEQQSLWLPTTVTLDTFLVVQRTENVKIMDLGTLLHQDVNVSILLISSIYSTFCNSSRTIK